jgi:hypothetical protein
MASTLTINSGVFGAVDIDLFNLLLQFQFYSNKGRHTNRIMLNSYHINDGMYTQVR